MRGRALLVLPVALSLACTCAGEDVMPAFRAAREEALAKAPAAPEPFDPDLVLHLSPALVQRLVEIGLEGNERLRSKVSAPGGVVLTPDLRIERVELVPAKGCDGCLGASVHLAGDVGYESGLAGKGKVPLTLDATIDLVLATATVKDGWTVTAKPERVRKVSLDVPGLPKMLVDLAADPLKDFAQAQLAGLAPTELVTVASADLPVRGFRVEPEGNAVRIAMLSDAVHPGKVPVRAPSLTTDWSLEASPESILWIARREAFALGPQAFGVVAVPERLSLDGNRFDLGLRLWRTEAPGWWRDYTAKGTVAVEDGRIRLSAKKVDEAGQSSGAGLADPLALLAEGFIVDGIADALQRTVPASGKTRAGGWKVDVDIADVVGEAGAITVSGSLGLTR